MNGKTKKPKSKTKRLIGLVGWYAKCCRADEMSGAQDPADRPYIEAELEQARSTLFGFIRGLKLDGNS